MKQLHTLALEQKEAAKHGEVFFPVQKYATTLDSAYPVVVTHWHEEAEFTMIRSGSAMYQIDLEDYPVEEGDLLFIPPRLLHSITIQEGQQARSDTFVFHLNFLGGNGTDLCATKYLTPLQNREYTLPYLIKPEHPAYTSLRKLFEQIHTLYDDTVPGYELALKALFLQSLFLLLQYGEKDETADHTTSDKLKTVLDYIELHYAEPLSVGDLAAQCYFSEYHFMRFFKKHINMTCVEYINNLRLEKAVEMFEQGNTSILDVSLSVGFHNLSYFHKVFKRRYHMTPKEFLRSL